MTFPDPRSTAPTSSSAASLARTPASPHPTVLGSLALAPVSSGSSTDSSTSTSDSSTKRDPGGSSSRTPKGFSEVTRDGTQPPSSVVWKTSGMGGPTGWWTGDTSAQPSDAVEFSWSAIVEETPDPHGPFWVTPTVAAKLLARVASAGPKADPALLQALSDLLEP